MLSSFFLRKVLVRSRLARFLPSLRRRLNGAERFLHHFSDRVLAAPFAEMSQLSFYRETTEPDAIDLAFGAPVFEAVSSESTRLPAHRRGWPPPQGMQDLRRAVADHLHEYHRATVNPFDEVLISHGGAGAFMTAAEAFVNPGDRVVLFDPSSPLFSLVLKQRRARLRWIGTEMKNGSNYFSRDELSNAMRGAKMIVLAQPNNPTGGVFEPQDLEYIAWWARRRDVLIYHDAAFAAFHGEGNPWRIDTHRHAPERTLIAGTVSKSHALTAARVGWLAGSRPVLSACTLAANLQAPFVPTLCQQIAQSALREERTRSESNWTDIMARRHYVADRLRLMGLRTVESRAGFFCWISLQSLAMTGQEAVERLWQDHRVLAFPGHFFGPSGENYIRLSFAGDHGRLAEGLRRLASFVQPRQTHQATSTPHSTISQDIRRTTEVTAN